MNREILFHGKRIDNREWVYGLIWKKKYNTDRICISYFPNEDDEEAVVRVIPETICQYTGLTDKNGRKIFDGDIVRLPDWITNHGEYAVCRYIDSANEVAAIIGFAFFDVNGKLVDIDEWDEFEIAGNVFDNPYLLKE